MEENRFLPFCPTPRRLEKKALGLSPDTCDWFMVRYGTEDLYSNGCILINKQLTKNIERYYGRRHKHDRDDRICADRIFTDLTGAIVPAVPFAEHQTEWAMSPNGMLNHVLLKVKNKIVVINRIYYDLAQRIYPHSTLTVRLPYNNRAIEIRDTTNEVVGLVMPMRVGAEWSVKEVKKIIATTRPETPSQSVAFDGRYRSG